MTKTAATGAPEIGKVRVSAEVELSYERRGDGPDIVLINNFFMGSSAWRPFTSRLETHCRLLAYDLRGQGGSTRITGEVTWDDHLADLTALLDRLEVAEAVVVGTSFSALLARDYALAHPDRVRGLVFAGPAMSPWGVLRHRRILKSWIATLDSLGLAAMYGQLYPLVSGDYKAEEAGTAGFIGRKQSFLVLHSAETVRSGLAASLMADPDPRLLTQIQCPTLLFVGDDDFTLGASAVDELTKLLPHGRSVVLPRAGHLPFLEEPEIFQDEVAAFVARIQQSVV